MSERFDEFIAAQHQTNIHLSEGVTRIETILTENTKRLFGGDGQIGALPYIMQKAEQNATEAEKHRATIETRTSSLETWKKTSLAWIAGAVAVLTLEGTALAFYFNSVAASHIKTIAGH